MDQVNEFEFLEQVFLRAPLYSFEDYSLSLIPQIILQKSFKNALWLASPDFYQVLALKEFVWEKLDSKERFSLLKYYNRMSFRPTPFGAFSSFSLISWQEQHTVRLGKDNLHLHLLPSRQWQIQYEKSLAAILNDNLLRTNPTIFVFGNTYRFIRSITGNTGKITFQVNEIRGELINVFLIEKCTNAAICKSELAGKLGEMTGCSLDEATDYLDYLLDEQVLLSNTAHGLIGKGFPGANQSIKQVQEMNLSGLDKFWKKVSTLPPTINEHLPEAAAELERLMPFPGVNFKKNIFYAGLERVVEKGGIHQEMQEELQDSVNLLRRIVIPYPTPALEDFKKAFRERFGEQHVPILRALDPDSGISYGGQHESMKSGGLLEDINFSPDAKSSSSQDWSKVHLYFLKIWLNNSRRLTFDPVIITSDILKELDKPKKNVKFPPSLAVMFTKNRDRLILDNSGGASALSLLGRFSVFSSEVSALCKSIADAETKANPEIFFAEIHQLSDTHTDNINRRMPLYSHVIDINTFPGASGQKELGLNDVLISVIGDELVLESVSLKKRIIPRLPTAFNFHHNELALFKLLGDLQFQGLHANFTFDLEKLFPGLNFYPRVEYRRTVLSLARWKISEIEVSKLLDKPLSLGRLHQFRQDRGVPSLITIGLSDQQLVFDLLEDDQALFFLECLKDHKKTTIKEYIRVDRGVTCDGKALNGQFITILQNSQPVYTKKIIQSGNKSPLLQRNFPPGGNWLYLKIYCTPESADKLLEKVIAPFLKAYFGEIAVWFFIRYQDPEPHIRLRIKSKTPDSGLLLKALSANLSRKGSKDMIRELKSDTYQREIERYSQELMEATEVFFCAGSDWYIAQLKNRNNQTVIGDTASFHLIWLLATDYLIDAQLIELFFKWRSDSFLTEFSSNKKLKVEMDKKYRLLSSSIAEAITTFTIADKQLTLIQKAIRQLRVALSVITEGSQSWPELKRYTLLADLIHMQVNRIFPTRQRQHEALICYCLYKYALTKKAKHHSAL